MGPQFRTSLKTLAWILGLASVVLLLTPLVLPLAGPAGKPIFWALLYLALVVVAAVRAVRRQAEEPFQFRLGTLFGIMSIIAILLGLFAIAVRSL